MVGTEQLELGLGFGSAASAPSLEFTPEPSPTVTFFDPILGAIQAPADTYGE